MLDFAFATLCTYKGTNLNEDRGAADGEQVILFDVLRSTFYAQGSFTPES